MITTMTTISELLKENSDRLCRVSLCWGITLRQAAELILNVDSAQTAPPPEEIEMDNLSEGSEESDWVMVEVTDTQPSTLTAIVEVEPASDDEDDWDNIPDLEDFDYGEAESVPSGARVTTEEESDDEEDWDNVPELEDFDYSLVWTDEPQPGDVVMKKKVRFAEILSTVCPGTFDFSELEVNHRKTARRWRNTHVHGDIRLQGPGSRTCLAARAEVFEDAWAKVWASAPAELRGAGRAQPEDEGLGTSPPPIPPGTSYAAVVNLNL